MAEPVGAGTGQRVPLRRSSAGTLHYQLYQTLFEMISSGAVKPGDRMPTEAELVESYGISRTTARRALDELHRQGLVTRQPGKGTFVRAPRLDAPIPHLRSITDEIEFLGHRPGIIPLSVEEATADEHVAAQLGLSPGDATLVVKRVRTADDRPVYVAESVLNVTAFPQLADEDYSDAGMYTVFERATGLRVSRAVQWLSAVPATRDVAGHLEVKTRAPVLKLERLVYLDDDRPVELVTGYFNGEIYRHYSEARRP